MKCEDVLTALQRTDASGELARRAATDHLARCEDCRNAAHALAVLRADRDLPIVIPGEEIYERAIVAAARGAPQLPARAGGFWGGLAVGAALAAGLAVAIVTLRPARAPVEPGAAPQVVLSVNELRDVSVALSSPEPLADAEIRVAIVGDIALRGFDDQRELRWRTNLDRGVNQLTLPLIALHAGNAQVTVEVQHGDKRRTFVVDIVTTDAGPVAAIVSACGSRNVGNASARRSCI
jgi:hypothetical protein